MINKYRWWEYLLIYAGLALFLMFMLAPFVEAFVVSLGPLDALFSIPYRFVTEEMSLGAYVTMWSSVPLLWRYMLNSFFIAAAVTVLGLLAIVPAAYAFARFHFRWRDGLVYTNGGQVIDENGEIVFNSRNNVQALEFYGKLAEVAQPGPIAYAREKLNPLFAEGQIEMYINGPWARALIGDVNWGVAPIPVGPMGGPGTLLITDSLAIFKGTGVEDQARDLVKTLTNPENQMAFELAEGFTPLRDLPQVAGLI